MSSKVPGRLGAAFIDLVAWTTIWLLVGWATDEIVHLSVPRSPGPPPDVVDVVAFGFGALCANLYLAMSAAQGRSLGKAMVGVRLIEATDGGRPGWARGIIRSSMQAGPFMGALMIVTGAHDRLAGTRIVLDQYQPAAPARRTDHRNHVAGVATWKIMLAVIFHLFCAPVYTILLAV